MFERFTHDARQIVVRAKTEANELHHRWIGTEHLLLAMLAVSPPDGHSPDEHSADGQSADGQSDNTHSDNGHSADGQSRSPHQNDEPGSAGELLRGAGLEVNAVRAEIVRLVGASSTPLLDEKDAEALRSVGIDLDAVLARIEESFGPEALLSETLLPAATAKRGWFGRRGQGGAGRFSARSKKVLELSLREAIRLHDTQISSAHILLGLLREGGGLAAKILADSGVDLDALQSKTEQTLRKAA